MNRTNTLQHKLHTWGYFSRKIPPHNEKLKNEALAHLVISSSAHIRATSLSSFSWASFVLAGFALFALMTMPASIDRQAFFPEPVINKKPAITKVDEQKQTMRMQATDSVQHEAMKSAPSIKFIPSFDANDGGFNTQQEIPITDPREYLKTDYNAVIYTRRVQESAQRIQIAVRGFNGRVDELNSSSKYGSIHFIIPASQFDAFQNEIINLAGKRFLIEDIYTQNMLPQKQSIEQRQESAKKTITQFNADRIELIAAHGRVLTAIQAQLAAYVYELDQLRREVTSDAVRQAQIAARIQWLVKEEKIINARLQNENVDYGRNLQSLDAQIRHARNNLEYVNTQDKELLDTVATVRGTISLHWISWWQAVNFSIPFPWIPTLLIGAAIAIYVVGRRRNRLMIL